MPEETPNDQPTPPRKQRMMTPEMRRFVGTPRPKHERPAPVVAPSAPEPAENPAPNPVLKTEGKAPEPGPSQPVQEREETPTTREEAEEQPEEKKRGMMRLDEKASRVPEMQRAIVIIAVLVVLGLTFFVGMRFPLWKYRFMMSRNAAKMDGTIAGKFPGVSAEELVEQALKLEREGKLQEAGERFLAAKHKNLALRGILARVAKLAYDHKDFVTADKLFEKAIEFGENVDTSNYFRGLIAVRRKDLPTAIRSFEAAVAAAPFVPDYQFYLGEAIRLDHHARDSISHYEHASLLARDETQSTICEFKIRMALLEAADTPKVKEQLEIKKAAGALSVDWLLTAAAIDLREGNVDEAIPLIALAREGRKPGLFATCITDAYFVEAAQKNPRVAEVCRVPSG